MAKLKLVPNPSFKSKVGIPVAGGEAAEVEFVFKHRTKTDLDAFINSRVDQSDVDSIMEMAIGWDLDDEFNANSLKTLTENYIGASVAIYRAYIDSLIAAKAKN